MRYINLFLIAALLLPSTYLFAGFFPPLVTNGINGIDMSRTEKEEELVAYYDLRNRKTYVQITHAGSDDTDSDTESANDNVCLHIQIFQQDKDCRELNYLDELTPNDTVIYDLENLVRNDGSPVPINLDDDSYGYVAVSAYQCERDGGNIIDGSADDSIIGNFRIVDDSGYEYRSNMQSESGDEIRNDLGFYISDIVINFNQVEDAKYTDIVGFVYDDVSGFPDGDPEDVVRNVPEGVSFSVFQVDEDEERLSCDTVNFACGPGKVMNYGLNQDLPASRGDNLLCQGGGLPENQSFGYVSLENPEFDIPSDNDLVINPTDLDGEFACFVGLNNGNGTGSMDSCQIVARISCGGCYSGMIEAETVSILLPNSSQPGPNPPFGTNGPQIFLDNTTCEGDPADVPLLIVPVFAENADQAASFFSMVAPGDFVEFTSINQDESCGDFTLFVLTEP